MRPGGAAKAGAGYAVALVILTAASALALLPIGATFLYSFFPKTEISAYLSKLKVFDDAKWLTILLSPAEVSLKQYYAILIEDLTVLNYFVNSAMYMAGILLGQVFVVPATAFALTKFKFKGREFILFSIIVFMALPFQVTMMPNVITLDMLKLLNTPWAIILPMWFTPFYIFLIRQFMLGVPDELLEAGAIDGAGPLRWFIHIMLPACRPVLGAAAALSFADSWNLVEQPLVFLSARQDLMPLSVMFNQIGEIKKEVAFAGAALYILPAIFIYMIFQDDIVRGVTLSELK
jgi:multiple sugar transport system permease protein